MHLDQSTQATIDKWLSGNYDPETKKQIKALLEAGAEKELTDSFYKNLEFGTGGLRGILGIGSNRINRYTIGTATQGLANYLHKKYPSEEIHVAIAHDSRNQSDVLARITADVFTANGIHVHFFEALRPTPQLSFAIRELNCKSGVMITASHNPKEYNGYKAYGEDGGQLTHPDDQLVMDEVAAIRHIGEVNFEGQPELLHSIGKEMDTRYIEQTSKLSVSPEAIARQSDLKIVYSPIHGTGFTLVPESLRAFGFNNVHIVEEQSAPDGNFPTVVYPNPEEKEALTLALNKAKALDADLVLATDPDADRVGIAVKNQAGDFVLLNGNQTGSLLIYYLLNSWEEKQKLTGNEYVVSTIVTTGLIKEMCDRKGVTYFNTLTGFKWIGKRMTELAGKKTFIGGGEESYGYLIGDLVRDKDAVISCAFIAEMTAYYKDKGSSLFEGMIQMYLEYGMYKEDLVSITRTGKSGAEEIKSMMQKFRKNPPTHLGGAEVVTLKDYEQGIETDLLTGNIKTLDFPKSDVLQFYTADGGIISARPSGTEPKIKFYCSVKEPLETASDFEKTEQKLNGKIRQIMEDLQS